MHLVCNAELARLCHERRVPLIVDEAHGGHFAFSQHFPQVLKPLDSLLHEQPTLAVLSLPSSSRAVLPFFYR